MIDLDHLHAQAVSDDGDCTVVERRWLAQVEKELRKGRAAQALVRRDAKIGKVIVEIHGDSHPQGATLIDYVRERSR